MFEVRAYVGDYRKGGFLSYKEAADHANEKVKETGQTHIVNEIVMRCIVRPHRARRLAG